jgi:hypothetical protein
MLIRPPNHLHPFHFPDYIEEALREFKGGSTWKTFEDLKKAYRQTFVTVPTYRVPMQKGTILFRARKNDTWDESLFKGLKDIGLKPKDKVKTFGRAGIPGEGVGYFSTNEETVVREVTQWYINDTGRAQDLFTKGVFGMGWNPFTCMMTISAWVVKEDLTLALLFNGDSARRSLAIRGYEEDRHNPEGKGAPDYVKSFNKVLDFFSAEFGKIDVKHELEYLFSAYYAHEIYHEINRLDPLHKMDGVKYASIANDYRGENIAICEDSFNRKVEFLGANFCYTYNSNLNNAGGDGSTCIIGRDKAGILLDDGTFDWVEASNDCSYIVRQGNEYLPLLLTSAGPVRPIVRLHA